MHKTDPMQFSDTLLEKSRELKNKLKAIVKETTDTELVIYNVFEYAWDGWCQYIKRYSNNTAQVLLLGINPGPHGMVQTGVPFGNISHVKGWLQLSPKIGTPRSTHHKRPVRGMEYTRDEPSGRLLWSSIQENFCSPELFFSKYFLINFCPLAFFDHDGKNLTPDKLSLSLRKDIERECITHLLAYMNLFSTTHIIGVGRYAYNHALKIINAHQVHRQEPCVSVHYLTHPSPLNPHHTHFGAEFLRLHTLIDEGH